MKKSLAFTLVLASYTRRFGIAVFRNAELRYFGVKTFSLPRTEESVRCEAAVAVENLINEFRPDLVIMKSPTKRQADSLIQQVVVNEIKRITELAGIPLTEKPFEDAKEKLSPLTRPTRTSTFAAVREIYPELRRLSDFQNPFQEEYYRPLLSAVAIGFIHSSDTAA